MPVDRTKVINLYYHLTAAAAGVKIHNVPMTIYRTPNRRLHIAAATVSLARQDRAVTDRKALLEIVAMVVPILWPKMLRRHRLKHGTRFL